MPKTSMRLYCDSRSAICIVQNHAFYETTKHIEVDCHVVREKNVSSANQLADLLTKPLGDLGCSSFVTS